MSAAATAQAVQDAKAAAAARPSKLRTLYPEIAPYNEGKLQVSDLHTIHYEESGNPQGKPIVIVHGGPGGGGVPSYRQYMDPKAYRIIMFDQRGAGQSTPAACLEENTTAHLIADMEKLREKLGVDTWVVFGGSWGSTLSLAYAQAHPKRVKALVLRGIFLVRRAEIQFFYQEGTNWMFPDAYERYASIIPQAERGDLVGAYHRRLTGNNEEEKLKAAMAWSVWEMETSRLYVDPEYIARAADDAKFAVQFARIETHYFVNGAFFEVEGQLLRDAHILREAKIPGTIVQGRYDMVCPMKSSYDLHKAWPEADYHVVADAGHSCKEDGIVHYLVEACDKYRDL